jgi:hypothetical protein
MSDVPQSTTHAATDTPGAHRTRSTWGGNWRTVSVYLTDAKRIDPPMKQAPAPAEPTAAENACNDGPRPQGTKPSNGAAHAAPA